MLNASSSSNFSGESEPAAIAVYYYLKDKAAEAPLLTVYQGNMKINEVKGINEPGINMVFWNLMRRRKRSEEEKKQIQAQMERYRKMGYRVRMDPNYESSPAPHGEYRFVLTINGKTYTGYASILQDIWYEK